MPVELHILHLSDLQTGHADSLFTQNGRARKLIPPLLEQIRRVVPRLDLIMVSGDVAETGGAADSLERYYASQRSQSGCNDPEGRFTVIMPDSYLDFVSC